MYTYIMSHIDWYTLKKAYCPVESCYNTNVTQYVWSKMVASKTLHLFCYSSRIMASVEPISRY